MKHTVSMRFVAALSVVAGAGPALAAPKRNLPLPRMVVAKAVRAPEIDGRMAPGEWDGAAACSAFVVAFHDRLAKNQSVAWFTYDDKHVYVCLKNNRGPYDTLLKKRARRDDDTAIVFDHANEVWLTPPSVPQATYQTLFNAYPGVLDVKMIPSVGYTAQAWRGGWELASSETRDHWIVEGRAPIRSFGRKRIADGDVWRGLFTCDVLGKGGGFRAWAPGGAFAEINRHGYLHFKDASPIFQLLDVESIFQGAFRFSMAAAAPAEDKATVEVTVRCGAGVQPAEGDLVVTKTVSVAKGRREALTLSGDVRRLDLPRRKVVVQNKPRVEKELPHGLCEITAKTEAGTVLYHQVFPFVVDGVVRRPPKEIRKSPYAEAFGLAAFHAPLNRKLVVKIDRLYMDRRAEAVAGRVRLIDPESKKAVAEREIAPFRRDYSQFAVDLAQLKVPVQTEADWAKAHSAAEENKRIAKENAKRRKAGEPELPLKPVPGPKPARYELQATLTTRDGEKLARVTRDIELMGYEFEWLGSRVGLSDKVIPPWTPVKWDARTRTATMWNKAYGLNGLGLAERIVNGGRPQLSAPMKLVARVGGADMEVIRTTAPELRKLTQAAAELEGAATLHNLAIRVKTRVEFDGFVHNTMTLTPRRPQRLDDLSLVVTMPAAEAPCFVTTSGGWSAYHGWTPERWDSRETSSGSRVGNFVPYVFLTDSDRGFCWFADNDRGWRLDPAKPTQELSRADGVVTLRVHFVSKAGPITKPTTIRYGWMVTPQKPQPPGWRATHIAPHKPYPKATAVFYGMDQINWAVLWPYYSSPYPWDYEKSKKAFDRSRANDVVLCAGNIAHAIARYRDYKGRWFNELAADWGSVPGDRSNGNVTRCRATNDFQVWHFDRWAKLSGMQGIYFDENYLSEEYNYLSGTAYLLPDERIQPGYSYLGLRQYDKRLRYMFAANGLKPPNLWLHTTSGHPVYAWMPDVAMEGENVSPTSLANDYMSCLPAARLRSIGMGRNLGAAPIIMCQADRHWNDAYSPFTCHQFVGWVLAHDCLPETGLIWPVLAAELEMWHDDIRFLPYWKEGLGIASKTKDVLVSAHCRTKGDGRAVLWIVNTARADREATVEIDFDKLALDPDKTIAFDAETHEAYELRPGDGRNVRRLTLPVPKRLWRAVRLMQPKRLTGGVTFVASFDGERAVADEAFGHRFARARGPNSPATVPGGKRGRAAGLDEQLTFDARHHLTRDRGRIAFDLQVTKASAGGTLLSIGGELVLRIGRGKLTLRPGKGAKQVQADVSLKAAPAWHAVEIAWRGRELTVSLDGKRALSAALEAGMPVLPMSRGLAINSRGRRHIRPTQITLGKLKGARIDNLVMATR